MMDVDGSLRKIRQVESGGYAMRVGGTGKGVANRDTEAPGATIHPAQPSTRTPKAAA
jgi:hypothetical protein